MVNYLQVIYRTAKHLLEEPRCREAHQGICSSIENQLPDGIMKTTSIRAFRYYFKLFLVQYKGIDADCHTLLDFPVDDAWSNTGARSNQDAYMQARREGTMWMGEYGERRLQLLREFVEWLENKIERAFVQVQTED